MDFVVAIPTYNRHKTILKQTLKFLELNGIDKENILIFVKDGFQFQKYMQVGLNDYKFVFTGQDGIKNTRNFLQEFFYFNNTHGDFVLYLDDDINELVQGLQERPVRNLVDILAEMAEKMYETGFNICGIAPYNNGFYLQPKKTDYTTTLKYICGGFRFEYIRRDLPLLKCSMGQFEDQQFNCEYFLRDGGVLRNNTIGIQTDHFQPEGGITEQVGGYDARQKLMHSNMGLMKGLYGDMVLLKKKKWGYDVALNRHFKLSS